MCRRGKINIAVARWLNSFSAQGWFPASFLAEAGIGVLGFVKTNNPRL